MTGAERQSLLAQLAHPDEELRRLAVEQTSLLPGHEALELLVGRLGDESWRVRKAAIARLCARSDCAAAADALVDALADGDNSGRRNAALEALVSAGRAVVPALIARSGSRDVDVRKQVIDVLGAIADPATEATLQAALADLDANVRAAAAEALAGLGSHVDTRRLADCAASDREPLVRLSALRALVRLGAEIAPDTIASALASPVLSVAALAALGASGDVGAIDAIAKRLTAKRASVRAAAARAAVALVANATAEDAARVEGSLRAAAAAHSEIVEDAATRLDDASGDERLAAVQFAALLGSPGLVPALVRAGLDRAAAPAARRALLALGAALPSALRQAWPRLSAVERAFACETLAALEAPAGAEHMLRTALLDPSAEVRTSAARSLGRCAEASVFGELFACLEQPAEGAARDAADEEASALIAAVLAIAERHGSEASDAAVTLVEARLLRGAEAGRLAGARLLAQLARPADAARVQGLLADPDARVRRHAVDAIAQLGVVGADLLRVALADEAGSVRAAAAFAIVRLGHESADEDLASLAADRDPRVRSAVMSALAQRAGDGRSRARSFELLAAGVRGDDLVALAALAALERVGGADAAAVAALALSSREPEIVERAVGCIGAHGGAPLASALVPLLAHEAWPVRARAARELAALRAPIAVPHLHARLAAESDGFVRGELLAALAALEA